MSLGTYGSRVVPMHLMTIVVLVDPGPGCDRAGSICTMSSSIRMTASTVMPLYLPPVSFATEGTCIFTDSDLRL